MTHWQLDEVWATAGSSKTSRTLFKFVKTLSTGERTGDRLPIHMRLAILLFLCPTDLEKELTAQQHLFPDFAQMRAHIVTVIDSRTRDPALMMMGNLNEEASNHGASSDEFVENEGGELQRLEI